jgi:Protein of unknown function (DUF732)
MRANITAAATAIAAIALAPVAAANKYSDADTAFLAAVVSGVGAGSGNHPLIDTAMMDQLIADGHKVCNLMDAGGSERIDSYILQKYDTQPAYPMYTFAWASAEAYCPWQKEALAEGGI